MQTFLRIIVAVLTIGLASTHGRDSTNDRVTLAQANSSQLVPTEENSESAEALTDGKAAVSAKLPAGDSLTDRSILEFVRHHQAELADLLEFMRAKQPANYQSAIRQISRSKQRMEMLSERDQEMYVLELDLWKINSKLRLLAARMSVAKSDAYVGLQEELKKLIVLEQGLAEAKLTLERTRAAARLRSLDEQLENHALQRDEIISKAIKIWESRAQKQSPRNNKNSKNKSATEVSNNSVQKG